MVDEPKLFSASSSHAGDESLSAGASVNQGSSLSSTAVDVSGETIALLEETLTVSKRRRSKGRVRVTTRTEMTKAVAEVELDRYRVEVTRVPVGCIVDKAPVARAEGDTTIIPVIEERFVVVKQLFSGRGTPHPPCGGAAGGERAGDVAATTRRCRAAGCRRQRDGSRRDATRIEVTTHRRRKAWDCWTAFSVR